MLTEHSVARKSNNSLLLKVTEFFHCSPVYESPFEKTHPFLRSATSFCGNVEKSRDSFIRKYVAVTVVSKILVPCVSTPSRVASSDNYLSPHVTTQTQIPCNILTLEELLKKLFIYVNR